MTADWQGPIRVFSANRRRASSANSAGLDYSHGHRVEEDILSRIRSLLIARNRHCPPRTPFHSDEDRHNCCEQCYTTDTSDPFHCSTAKSVTRLLRRTERSNLALPLTHSTTLMMDGARKSTQTSIPAPKQSLRATSSTNDLNVSVDDSAFDAAPGSCCSPCQPEGTKKTFRLPRFVLREQILKKKRDLKFRSSVDLNPQSPPPDVAQPDRRGTPDYSQYPAKTSNESDSQQPLRDEAVKAEPADLACFLAGCGPGMCKTHSRKTSQSAAVRNVSSARSVDKFVPDSMAKLGLSIVAVNQYVDAPNHSFLEGKNAQNKIRLLPNECGEQRNLINTSATLKSNRSSLSAIDAFPHALYSQELTAKVAKEDLSSTVITNFSLPGPKVRSNQPRDATESDQSGAPLSKASDSVRFKSPVTSLAMIVESGSPEPNDTVKEGPSDFMRAKKSDSSLKSRVYSPSLGSVSSKAGSIRHALLKSHGPDTDVADAALPIPPIVTQVVVTSSDTYAPGRVSPTKNVLEGSSENILRPINAEVIEAVVHLTSLKKAKDLADRIQNRNNKMNVTDKRVRDEKSASNFQQSFQHMGLVESDKVVTKPTVTSIESLKGLLGTPNATLSPTPKESSSTTKKPFCCSEPAKEPSQSPPEGDLGQGTGWQGLRTQALRLALWSVLHDVELENDPRFFHKVDDRFRSPIRTVWLAAFLAFCLALPSLGSSVAFAAATSIATIGLYISYGIPILIGLIYPKTFKKGPFNLGFMSRIVALIAVCWIAFITIIFCLPTTNPVTSQTINYTVVAVGIIAIFSLVAWFVSARKWFVGPLKEIQEAERLGVNPNEPGELEAAEPELFGESKSEKL